MNYMMIRGYDFTILILIFFPEIFTLNITSINLFFFYVEFAIVGHLLFSREHSLLSLANL